MTNDSEKTRIVEVEQGDIQTKSFFLATYGLTEEGFATIEQPISLWAKHNDLSDFCRGTDRSRWIFERYYAAFRLLAPLTAAYRVGMDASSFTRLLSFAQNTLGMPKECLGIPGATVPESFTKTLQDHLPSVRTTLFSSHSSYCRSLHRALDAEGVEITPAYDPTSKLLDPSNPDFGRSVDIVTLGPVGNRYNVWLDSTKPISLEPDKVSLVTYARYQALLQSRVPNYHPVDTKLLKRVQKAMAHE